MRIIRSLGAGLSLTLAAACAPSLSGPKLDNDPNTPSTATSKQLLSAIQANGNILLNGPGTRLASMWVQQMAGTDRQYQSFGLYQGLTESNYDTPWGAVYTGGGLVDVLIIETNARAAADRTYLGIAEVWEASSSALPPICGAMSRTRTCSQAHRSRHSTSRRTCMLPCRRSSTRPLQT